MKMLEHKISWKVLKILAQDCSNDFLGLTLTIEFAFLMLLYEQMLKYKSS